MLRTHNASSDSRRAGRVVRTWSVWLLVVAMAVAAVGKANAQAPADTMNFYKALDLEAAGKYRDAVPLFRSALRTSAAVNALLGLERVYAELGWSDSLVAALDTLIAANPQEETYRTVQLRTLQASGKDADLKRALDRWMHDMPTSAAPSGAATSVSKLLRDSGRAR